MLGNSTVQKLLFIMATVSTFGTSDWNQDTCASGYTKHKILNNDYESDIPDYSPTIRVKRWKCVCDAADIEDCDYQPDPSNDREMSSAPAYYNFRSIVPHVNNVSPVSNSNKHAVAAKIYEFYEGTHQEQRRQDIKQSEQSRRVLGASAKTRTAKTCNSCTTGSSETVNVPKRWPWGYGADVTVCKHDTPNNDKYCMDWTIPDNCTLLTPQHIEFLLGPGAPDLGVGSLTTRLREKLNALGGSKCNAGMWQVNSETFLNDMAQLLTSIFPSGNGIPSAGTVVEDLNAFLVPFEQQNQTMYFKFGDSNAKWVEDDGSTVEEVVTRWPGTDWAWTAPEGWRTEANANNLRIWEPFLSAVQILSCDDRVSAKVMSQSPGTGGVGRMDGWCCEDATGAPSLPHTNFNGNFKRKEGVTCAVTWNDLDSLWRTIVSEVRQKLSTMNKCTCANGLAAGIQPVAHANFACGDGMPGMDGSKSSTTGDGCRSTTFQAQMEANFPDSPERQLECPYCGDHGAGVCCNNFKGKGDANCPAGYGGNGWGFWTCVANPEALKTPCPTDGAEKCVLCDPDFVLSGDSCVLAYFRKTNDSGDCPTGYSQISTETQCRAAAAHSVSHDLGITSSSGKSCQWGEARSSTNSNYRMTSWGGRPRGCWQDSGSNGCVYWNPNANDLATWGSSRSICVKS